MWLVCNFRLGHNVDKAPPARSLQADQPSHRHESETRDAVADHDNSDHEYH